MGMLRRKRQPPVSGSKLGRLTLTWGTEERKAMNRTLVSYTVAEGTLKKYKGRIAQLEDFSKETGLGMFSSALMEDFIFALYASGFQGSTAGGYKAAWLINFKLNKQPPVSFSEDEHLNTLISGFVYRAGLIDNGRGTLDSGMLSQLVDFAASRGHHEYVAGYVIAWHGMFRHTAWQEVTVGDVRLNAKGGPLIFIPHAKSFSAKRKDQTRKGHFKPVSECRELLKSLTLNGTRREEERLLVWDQAKARSIIAECAEYHNWDAQKVWDFHSFRLGAACEMRTMEHPDAKMMRKAVWSADSHSIVARYRRSWKIKGE